MEVESLQRRLTRSRPDRRVGKPEFRMDRRRGELLAGVYMVGDLGVLCAWLADPGDITNRVGMAVIMGLVLCSSVALFVLRRQLPAWVGDVAIVGSVVLITAANLFCRVHVHVGLFTPYYVWVGFAAPMWFPRRRAMSYVALSVLASGVVALVSDNDAAHAAWVVTTATAIVAFVIVDSLTRALVGRERLAAVGEMASVVSHELRNPLGAMANAVFLLRHAMRDNLAPEIEQNLTMADREIDKANGIIDHLVAYVRPRQPVMEPVVLRDMVDEVLETTPPPEGVRVHAEVGAAMPLVDRGHLAEVLVNLVANAYDAMPDGGAVHIGARAGDHSVVITVADTGPGVDRAVAERVFEPFVTTKHTGTGLGLAIVHRLLEVNNGVIAVDSPPGGGARFSVTLPASRAVTRPDTTTSAPAAHTPDAVAHEAP